MRDLWGKEHEEDEGEYCRNAYPRKPGTGPDGELCKTCAHLFNSRYGAKNYYKCGLMPHTAGPGTDIVLKSPACRKWRAQ